jgi:TonB family protein
MKLWQFLVAFAAALAPTFAAAQTPGNAAPSPLNFENGVIANGAYSNECFGFSLPLPTGWKVDESITAGGKARHRSDKNLLLLFLRKEGDPVGGIILSASAPTDQTSSARDFVSTTVHDQIKVSADRKLLHDAAGVDYGGQHFFRADFQGLLGGKQPVHLAYVYTKFRGYMIGETAEATSPQGLDEAVNSLQAISFHGDQVNPSCVMVPEPAIKPAAQRVRISSNVAVLFLVKKVNPKYPDDARHDRIQGQVVMKVEISKDGDVESVDLVSGHPALAPAAIEAVKQWKYKPYLLNGIPMAVETQVIVNFSLSES